MEFHRKTFELSLVTVIIVDLLATIAFFTPHLPAILFVLICLAVFCVAIRQFEFAIYILFAELFVGAQGRLLSVMVGDFSLSLRQGIFIAVAFAWVWHVARKRYSLAQIPMRRIILGFTLFCVTGTLAGLYYHNTRSNIFFDANGYFYIVMAWPVLSAIHTRKHVYQLLTVLFACATFLTIKGLTLLALFSHSYSFIPELYRAVRDTRMYEIMAIPNGKNLYRIFSQSQIFSVVSLFFALPLSLIVPKQSRKIFVALLVVVFIVIVMSLSRSYWLAMLLTGLVFLGILWRDSVFSLIHNRYTWLTAAAIIVASGVIILFTINYPYLWNRAGSGNPLSLLGARSTSLDDSAAASRYALLQPLAHASLRHPIFGSGFGTTVTYQSKDPRIVTATGGSYTTFAFEWGFLDIALKVGIFGLFIMLAWIVSLIMQLWKAYRIQSSVSDRSVLLGAFGVVIAVTLTHATSPYLNHPIGIGILLFTTAIASVFTHDRQTISS